MRDFVFIIIVIPVGYDNIDIPSRVLHSPKNLLFGVYPGILSSKTGFGLRNRLGILPFSG